MLNQNEIYYSLESTTIISPTDILARCAVSDDPMDASDLGDPDNDEHKFCCFYAINAEKGVFYAFNWQSHRDKAIHNQSGKVVRPNAWIVIPRDEDIHKASAAQGNKDLQAYSLYPRKKRRLDNGDEAVEDSDIESSIDDSAEDFQLTDASDSEDDGAANSDDASVSASPELSSSRKRRRGALSIPAKARGVNQGSQIFQTPTKQKVSSRRTVVLSPIKPSASVAPTPHSKAVLRTRQKLKTRRAAGAQRLAAPELSVADAKTLAHLPKDAQLRAMHVLHVGSRPDSLPCREEEFADVLEKVLVLLEDGVGGCVCERHSTTCSRTGSAHYPS
jgi:origin recognition complex subunit 1